MKKKPLQLDDLIDMDTPETVLEEVRTILTQLPDTQDPGRIEAAFGTTVALYQGEYPGYHGCNIAYHNLHHITDTFLAMTRLIHGAHLNGTSLPWLVVELGLISSLFHDTGYIQETHDCDGTGAKHTLNHVQRSMDFVARHALEHSLAEDETALCRDMILCTDLAADIGTTAFPTPQAQLAGKMLGSADLLAQMADRIYLEKLLYLYEEFREGKVSGYDNEVDLLRKTVGFYDIIEKRLATVLESTDRYMISHFKDRWGLDRDLYHISMQNQKAYLRKIIQIPDINPLDYLRRDGIVNSYRDKNNHQNSTNNTVVDE